MSEQYEYNKADLINIGKVLFWSMISAGLGALIVALSSVEFPPQYMFLVAFINVFLVAMKKLVDAGK
jgi:hypothetical protein